MSPLLIIPLVLGGILLLLVLWTFGLYNGLVRARNAVRNAWSQIDVQLKRRHDLIPNLVETVTGYMQHESGTLEAVTNARTAAINASGVAESGKAEGALTGALKSLFAVSEAYPDLKANANFLALQEELASTKTRSPSPGRPTTTQPWSTTTRPKSCLRPSSPACSIFIRPSFSKSKPRPRGKSPRSAFPTNRNSGVLRCGS